VKIEETGLRLTVTGEIGLIPRVMVTGETVEIGEMGLRLTVTGEIGETGLRLIVTGEIGEMEGCSAREVTSQSHEVTGDKGETEKETEERRTVEGS